MLNRDHWAAFAGRHGLNPDFPNAQAASAAIMARVAQLLRDQPEYAQVRAVHSQVQTWTVEDGSLSPTLKIKRYVIEERYRSEIEALYAEQTSRRSSGG
ncbi:hypothetical protein GV827_21035 [Sulfitobacter sp. JBTF-M27]|uniref:Uncharacterized protein n=1 Tax=Sulfitobacter sediminilitoris TaxID=2698830 RepID=A0A6P0CHK1_9RHOB|nr:hypothetical protein [Sulfitobacter sediminilitoris]NEK24860.1 hypothetical protein [Sulfitobacter sediminilitoris]